MATADHELVSERCSGRDDPGALLRAYGTTGDPDARARLVEMYLPLVRSLARRYAHCGEGLEDLVQVGSIGLIEAIDRFDPDRGSDLAGYAIPTITGEIKRHLRDRATIVRMPRRPSENALQLRSAREALVAQLRRSPTVSELAEELGLDEQDVEEAMETERARVTLRLAACDGESGELDGALGVESAYEKSEERMLLAAGFRTLTERERRILHLRFFGGLSQTEIAGEVGLSQIHVSRIIRNSLERLHAALDSRTTVESSAGAGKSLVRL